eukprot:2796194-Rhodomonas_salina.2
MTSHSWWPYWVLNAVFSTSLGAILTCQYPDLRSSLEKYLAFPSLSRQSSIRGRGYLDSKRAANPGIFSAWGIPAGFGTPPDLVWAWAPGHKVLEAAWRSRRA